MIRASAPYTSGWGSFVLLKIDRVRVARGGSLSTLHRKIFYIKARYSAKHTADSRVFLSYWVKCSPCVLPSWSGLCQQSPFHPLCKRLVIETRESVFLSHVCFEPTPTLLFVTN